MRPGREAIGQDGAVQHDDATRARSPAGHDAIADAERATLAQLDDLTDELARLP